mgnify:CR=1 FL=1
MTICCLVLGLTASAAERCCGSGGAEMGGELKQWHKVTLTLDGPYARERDQDPNPFLDYRLTVTFAHESGSPQYRVPGYFAADGHAAETSAESGNKWRAHLCPDRPGKWTYRVSFVRGKLCAVDPAMAGQPVAPADGMSGDFLIAPTDKSGRDFRAQGRLEYVGQRYLRFAGSGEYFLKAGADSPENFLAYYAFDGTRSLKPPAAGRKGEARPAGLHRYRPHARDYRPGDPTWQNGKGKEIVGALNYLAGKGCNAFSFLTYNVGGDGDDVWPFVEPDDKLHYDCSKLHQWQIVFDHAQAQGLFLHFKMQETENDDLRYPQRLAARVPAALDGGDLGTERKLYCRELVARFGYALALNWNLGEENSQTTEQQRDMARYLRATDPYPHPIVVHTFPNAQDRVYPPLLGDRSPLSGASLQNGWNAAHQRVLKWVAASAAAGKPWVVANDEQNPADMGVPPDPGYAGHDGKARQGDTAYDLHDIRRLTLWGTLMAGGAGVEYYFGYKLPQNDLVCEDWRSRDQSWDYCRIALDFFREQQFVRCEMENLDELVGNPGHDNSKFCFGQKGGQYLVYLPEGGSCEIDLAGQSGIFQVSWFDPRHGGPLARGSVAQVPAGGKVRLGDPPHSPEQDWVALITRRPPGGDATQ